MVQLSSKNSFRNIENSLEKLDSAAWVWDADRNRIIAANGMAVEFWHELSVLDLIDTLFGEYHPMSLQFAKASELTLDTADMVDMAVDFASMGIAALDGTENINCQFSKLESGDDRHVILVQIGKVATVSEADLEDALAAPLTIQGDEMIVKMLDNAPAALALFDHNGRFYYANEQCQQIFGRKSQPFDAPAALSDWFVTEAKTADEAHTIAKNLIEKCLNYKIANISVELNTAFGARIHSVVAKSFAIKPFDDGQQYVLIYLRDVADERHYEQILVERIAKLEQLTKLGSDFYFILDDELDFVQLGGNFETLTGYPASELLGENWHDVAKRFELDPDGVATAYFADQKSFDNLSIEWPVKDSETSLSLTWRGRSIYEEQDGESIFVGNFVTAFENILSISDDEFSEHIELIEDGDDIDIDTFDMIDEFDDKDEIAALAKLDGVDSVDEVSDEDNIDEDNQKEQISDVEFSALETNLSDVEAVNFAEIGEALAAESDDIDEAGSDDEAVSETAEESVSHAIEDVISRSDEVIAEINEILGETASADQAQKNIIDKPMAAVSHLADNIVPAFGATAQDIEKFGRTEVDIFKLVLDQTPVMAVITSLPSEEGMYTLFANKEVLHNLELIEDKDQDLDSGEYTNILSVESMEILNTLKDEFTEIPLDQEVSFLVEGKKHYFNAKINKIDWQNNKALQYILSPKIDLDTLNTSHEANIAPAAIDLENNTESAVQYSEQNKSGAQFVLDAQAFIDDEQNILSSNVYLNNILNIDREELIGTPIVDIVTKDDASVFEDYVNSVLQKDEKNLSLDGVELDLVNKTGENHTVFMHIQRLSEDDAKNQPSDILVNMRDISFWKKKEANLREAKDRAEQENVQKSGFLARISHELRTPLNAIIGFSEVMSDEKFGPLENSRYKGYAHDINESGAHLLSLINDLLDLSKIEAGKVELDFKALDLEPLIVQAVSLMQPMADKKRIIIRTSISSTLPQIVADMRSIRQIILNLLSNSIKYSNPGSQVIMSALLDDDGEVIIRVRDTGIGMSEDQLKTAMEPFKTLNMSTLVDRQGTGLGLPLTKALAEANRADFSIESAVNAGTLVQITFPTTRVLNA